MKTDMIILYVADPMASAAFYARILGQEANELSPGFGLFALPSGLKLGLWIRRGVQPPAEFSGCGAEIVIHSEISADVEATHRSWQEAGIAVLDPPTTREFGTSFVVADPDGHRIRVLHPEG